jgi:hypothetical protein
MPLRGRVGRHTQSGGRHCQNWVEDQEAVIMLLNHVPLSSGGAGGSLDGRIHGRMVAGMASEALYASISRFEDMHFPRQRSGFVDPGGAMLRRMQDLASRASEPADELPTLDPVPATFFDKSIDFQRRKVLDERKAKLFSEAERKAFKPLVDMAVKHIDSLKNDLGRTELPWPVGMFGRAYITKDVVPVVEKDGSVVFLALSFSGRRSLPLPEMRYGQPIDMQMDITTGKLGALLLYSRLGECCRVPPYHRGAINHLGPPFMFDPIPLGRI